MGLFDFLFGGRSRVQLLDDRIWLSERAKINGIRRDIGETDDARPDGLFVLAQFPASLEPLLNMSQRLAIPSEFCLAEEFEQRSHPDWSRNERANIEIIVAERHFLASQDEQIIERAKELPCHCRVRFHESLESPLMRKFSGPTVEKMLRTLGMTEDEAIESRMVSRQITAAQRDLEAKCIGDSAAESAEEWLERNYRE